MTSPILTVTSLPELTGIFKPTVEIAVWNRPVNPAIQQFLRQSSSSRPFNLDKSVQVRSPDLHRSLPELNFNDAGREFMFDLLNLIELFGSLLDCETVRVQLLTLDSQLCPAFHSDRMKMRLICTYLGNGTQFITGQRWSRANDDQTTPYQINPAQISPESIHNLQEFQVGIYKGDLWAPNQHGLVHRSPSTEKHDTKRILFSVEPFQS